MLEISILSSMAQYDFNKIFIFSDPNDPVKKTFSNVAVVIQREKGSLKLYGLDNIRDMHSCMKLAAEDCEYILKKDSDILDCSNYAYKELEKGKWDCYGTFPMARANVVPENHFNGNAYFIKSSIVKQFPEEFPEEVGVWGVLNYPEDMVTSAICATLTGNTRIDGAAHYRDGRYLFDIFLSDVASKTKEEIKRYGFVHCRSNYKIMEYLVLKIYDAS